MHAFQKRRTSILRTPKQKQNNKKMLKTRHSDKTHTRIIRKRKSTEDLARWTGNFICVAGAEPKNIFGVSLFSTHRIERWECFWIAHQHHIKKTSRESRVGAKLNLWLFKISFLIFFYILKKCFQPTTRHKTNIHTHSHILNT